MAKQKIFYYSSFKEDFSGSNIKTKTINEKYKYIKSNFLYNFLCFVFYRLIATPISFIFVKITTFNKIKNKHLLKPFRKTGYFIYGNHTLTSCDPFIPTFVVFPKRNYIIVHPDNVSQKFVGSLMPMLGALPLPSNLSANRNFINAIEKRINQNHSITIYPEASIWPYYNKIRPFESTSFTYPVKMNKPVFCFTNTFQKRKFGKKPKVVTYIDGPFYPDKSLSLSEQKIYLRDKVFDCMNSRCEKYSTYQYTKFIKKENTND